MLQVRSLQSRLSDSNSLTAKLQRDMVLVKGKAEALEYAVSEKDAEIELLRQRHERQETQVASTCILKHCAHACHSRTIQSPMPVHDRH